MACPGVERSSTARQAERASPLVTLPPPFLFRRFVHGITGHEVEYYTFDDMRRTAYTADEKPLNVLALSRNLPDPRGGVDGAGAVPEVVEATASIHLSKRRHADLTESEGKE